MAIRITRRNAAGTDDTVNDIWPADLDPRKKLLYPNKPSDEFGPIDTPAQHAIPCSQGEAGVEPSTADNEYGNVLQRYCP